MTDDSTHDRENRPQDDAAELDASEADAGEHGTDRDAEGRGREDEGSAGGRRADRGTASGGDRPDASPPGGDRSGANARRSSATRRRGRPGGPLSGGDVRTKLLWVSLGVLGLLAAFSLLQFYTHASTAIDVWIAGRYRPVVQAVFNLAVLLAAGGGIAVVVRRIVDRRSGSGTGG